MENTKKENVPDPKIVAAVAAIKKNYDTNQDGILDAKEIEAMKEDYLKNSSPIMHVLREHYDINKDGQLDESEIEKLHQDIRSTETNFRYAAYTRALPQLLRYTAYTSDVGEAFRPIAHPRLVTSAYGVSWLYVLGDVGYEGYKDYKYKDVHGMDLAQHITKRATFQAVASMALPAFTIHSTVKVFKKVFNKIGRFQKWGPTVAGLVVVPVLPFIWDHPVEYIVDGIFDWAWPTRVPHPDSHHKH